jgi:LmbE family N-acetylglucosaminyl deacetylase
LCKVHVFGQKSSLGLSEQTIFNPSSWFEVRIKAVEDKDDLPVSVVIPAFNERGLLRHVLSVVFMITELAEVIIVDDGSTDGTEQDYLDFQEKENRLRVIRHPHNLGKTQALRTGVEAACNPLILFLDADLHGLKPEHIRDLIRPVQDGDADMTIGVFRDGKLMTDLSQRITPWLSGQRCILRSLFFEVPLERVTGYGIETAFTITARRRGWRVCRIPLHGLFQRPAEIRHGIFKGYKIKMRMYAQIGRTWLVLRELPHPKPGLTAQLRVLALCLAIMLSLSLVYNRSRAEAIIQPQDLPLFNFDGASRILVVAPHPDDETLGAGGLIQSAIENNIQVRVLVFTNGDGQPASAVIQGGDQAPRSEDYIRAGEIHQQETLNGLKFLGLASDRVDFLGYPDRQLSQLWLADWKSHCPLHGVFTKVTAVPYPQVYHPGAAYCGDTVLESSRQILDDYRPDLIFLPQINDDHPDHRAASQFILMTVAQLFAQDPSYQPSIWGYIIQYGSYPKLLGWHLNSSLVPPLPMMSSVQLWSRFDLTADQETRKAQAIRAYPSQLELMNSFLESFARQDEIFERIELLEFSDQLLDNCNLQQLTATADPNTSEQALENTHQFLLPGADLINLHVTNVGDTIQVTAETRSTLLSEVYYGIQFKLEDGNTKNCTLGEEGLRQGRADFACVLDLSNYARPFVIGFDAITSRAGNLDRTGWHFIILR